MVAFIDDHRMTYGVEPICRVLPIAPSTYFRRKAEQRDSSKRSARAQDDEVLRAIIRRIWTENQQVYRPRNVWKQMSRENLRAARCRVRRLMREMGLAGAVRGRAWTTTTGGLGQGRSAERLGRPPIHGHAAESTLGVGLHVRRDVARLRVRRVRHRRLRPSDCRLARVLVLGDRLRPRRA